MPTYEYQCNTCKTVFDHFQSIKSAPLRKAECPTCKKQRSVRRLISTGGAVLFKGSGFYQTDYRSDRYKEAAKADTAKTSPTADAGKAEAGKSSETTATKPATAPASDDTVSKPKKKSKE
jgi:putative FmdB family regulatory protein